MQRIFIIFLSLFFFSCSRTVDDPSVVASVGKNNLTSDEIKRLNLFSSNEMLSFAGAWVNEEILYQNALKSGLNKKALSGSNIDNYQRRLLGQQFLFNLAKNNLSVSREEVLSFYNQNEPDFKRLQESVRLYHFLSKDKNEAGRILSSLGIARKTNEKNELFSSLGVHAAVVYKGELIPELDKALFSKKSKKQYIGPLQSKYGYHVLYVLERYSQGSLMPLNEVYDEIQQRIYQQKLALRSLNILDSLLNQTPYKINLK